MDFLPLIKYPIEEDLNRFVNLFNESLTHTDGLLSQALAHIRSRAGKRMRPMLILLMAKNYGCVTDATQYAAVGLELLHTASLVHDDVVDESNERRGQTSVNAIYDNKVAVLVGDYILSTALLYVSHTHSEVIVRYLSQLGRTLSNGEILQLSNISNNNISEEVYYSVIKQKTAALFEACAAIGALSSGCSEEHVKIASEFGRNLGIVFQIRDDIFDYYDTNDIGKPTGNDMAEGKLTLPVIYALNTTKNKNMLDLAYKVKKGNIEPSEIATLVQFTKDNGGIEYAEKCMDDFRMKAMDFINIEATDVNIKKALTAYVDFVIQRKQ